MNTLLLLVLLISPTSLACQHERRSNFVSRNTHSNDPLKFHLRNEQNNHYLWLEPNTMMLRAVTSMEFSTSRTDHMSWFTACNNFIPPTNSQNFEICMAGIENYRLYYDEENKIFMLLPPTQRQNRHFSLSMTFISNKVTGCFEKSRIMCSKGNLILDGQQLKIEENQAPTVLRVDQ